jgi:hypothetical protein
MNTYELKRRHMKGHEIKWEWIGKKADIAKFDICICTDGSIRIRPEGKCGKIKIGDTDMLIHK